MWEEMEQSLFSFWLNQALKGHADANGDGRIDCDELYQFVNSNVKESAQAVYGGAEQTPVRIIGSNTHGTPIVVKLTAYTLKGVLDDMAEQLARVVEVKHLSPVGVATFVPLAADPKILPLLRNESVRSAITAGRNSSGGWPTRPRAASRCSITSRCRNR